MKPRYPIAQVFRSLVLLSLLLSFVFAQPLPAVAHPPQQQSTNTTGWFPFTPSGSDSVKTWTSAAALLLDSPTDNPATLIDRRGFVQTNANGQFVCFYHLETPNWPATAPVHSGRTPRTTPSSSTRRNLTGSAPLPCPHSIASS